MKIKDKNKNVDTQIVFNFVKSMKSKIIRSFVTRKVQQNRKELLKLGDYLLRDIGIDKESVERRGKRRSL